MNNKQPLVSVIMPVYNAEKFLREAIDSVVNQTYKNLELIIVDDGSRDSSWRIIKDYSKKFPKIIKSYRLKVNTNAAGNGAVNTVLIKAKGEYIARMDADDVSSHKRVEKQVKFLNKNPKVILVGTQANVINEYGKIVGKKVYPLTHNEIYKKYAEVHPIIHPSCMIRRKLLPNWNRLYDMRFGVNDDYYTFFKLLNIGQFANLPDLLVNYRIHKNNASLQNLKEKYQNISAIRKTAVKEHNYRISNKTRFVIALQSFMVFLMPEKLLTSFYLFIRGMSR